MGWVIVVATYVVAAVFYLRLGTHALRWLEAAWGEPAQPRRGLEDALRSGLAAVLDVLLLPRLFRVNPALWLGEWLFHASLLLVLLRHLRYFTEPVPAWVVGVQTPAWIGGFLLPAALLFVLAIRVLTKREKFSSPVNLLMLLDLVGIAVTGLLLATRHRVDLVQVKAYALGIVTFRPAPPPADWLLTAHLTLFLVLVLYIPSHVFTVPFSLFDARGRDRELDRVLHDA
jgi:nitrate reductase gamma subunit